MQTRTQSLIEAWSHTLIGYVINLAVQLMVYPFYGATFTFGQNIQIGLIFMAVSILRGYGLRRFFNWHFGKRLTPKKRADAFMDGFAHPINPIDK